MSKEYKKDVYFEALVESTLSHKENLSEELEKADSLADRMLNVLLTPIEKTIFITRTEGKTSWEELGKKTKLPKNKMVWILSRVNKRLISFRKFLENF